MDDKETSDESEGADELVEGDDIEEEIDNLKEQLKKYRIASKDIPSKILKYNGNLPKGANAFVVKAVLRGRKVAIKVPLKDVDELQFLRECSYMCSLHDENVLMWKGWCKHKSKTAWGGKEVKYLIVTSWMDQGDLSGILHHPKDPTAAPLPVMRKMEIIKQIILGMNWIHSLEPPTLHLDLKPANILLDKNGVIKIADFGSARDKDFITGDGVAGTWDYMAPELFLPTTVPDEKADVYSFGVIVWEIWTQRHPWEGLSPHDVVEQAVAGQRPPIPKDCPTKLRKLIESCWHADPKQRPSFPEMVETHIPLLDGVALKDLIGCSKATSFWQTTFGAENFEDSVEWDVFSVAFSQYFEIKSDLVDELEPLFATDGGQVSPHGFARVVKTFGPLKHLQDFMNVAIDAASMINFFAYQYTILDASSDNIGTWVVRFSSEAPHLTIEVICIKDKKKCLDKHAIIRSTADGNFMWEDKTFPLVSQVINFIQDRDGDLPFKLLTPKPRPASPTGRKTTPYQNPPKKTDQGKEKEMGKEKPTKEKTEKEKEEENRKMKEKKKRGTVEDYLNTWHLGHLMPSFKAAGVDNVTLLLQLTEADFNDPRLGLKVTGSEQQRLLKEIRTLKQRRHEALEKKRYLEGLNRRLEQAIVRVAMARRQIDEASLFKEVVAMVSPSGGMSESAMKVAFKKSVDSLIERCYLEGFGEDEHKVYRYLA